MGLPGRHCDGVLHALYESMRVMFAVLSTGTPPWRVFWSQILVFLVQQEVCHKNCSSIFGQAVASYVQG